MKLYIGNKKYSSWSFRPWFAARMAKIEFEEILVPFDMTAGNPKFKEFSPTGKVPCLVNDGVTVWESLAIMEYMADKFPDAGLWPDDIKIRAIARSVAHEMHGGYGNLRNECPMNMAYTPKALKVSDGVRADVARIEQSWDDCLQKSGGSYLFGDFSIADAMFAPVVNRLEIYKLSEHSAVQAYSKTMKQTAAWQEWELAGRAEPWIVDDDEV